MNYLLFWGIIGGILFTLLVYIFFLTGIIYAAVENPDTKTKKKGLIGSFIILIGIVSIQTMSTFISLNNYRSNHDIIGIFVLNYILFLLLFLYDTLIVDILILVKWHPEFMHLPDEEVFTSVTYHLKTLIPGSILGLIITVISVIISVVIIQ